MIKQKRTIYIIVLFSLALIFILAYSGWNAAHPRKSCASCHEISPAVETQLASAHRNISCSECHGTALSGGLHSMTQTLNMLFKHFTGKGGENENFRMSEPQILEVMNRCEKCHRTQFADWRSGGHSATYAHIFMDKVHNKMEPPYWDCFRCHGMFYDGTIYDLMQPVDNKGPWKFEDAEQADRPTVPCLACHEIHSENDVRGHAHAYENPKNIFYERDQRSIPYGLYLRADSMFMRADQFVEPAIYKKGEAVITPGEFDYRLCIQCHSPNFAHEAGSEDDRTPTGIHEGITCSACHAPHSNDAKKSCGNCHPAVSNCGLDVKTMNTSYLTAKSPNNIHSMTCLDCHKEGIPD